MYWSTNLHFDNTYGAGWVDKKKDKGVTEQKEQKKIVFCQKVFR
jgi:hypothetical protein